MRTAGWVGMLSVAGLLGCQPETGGGAEGSLPEAAEGSSSSPGAAEGSLPEAAEGSLSKAAEGSLSNAAEGSLTTDEAKASYTVGFSMANQVATQFGDAIDRDAFMAGIDARLADEPSAVSAEDSQRAMAALDTAKRAADEVSASTNAKVGAKFLADNAERQGVTTTDSGLQYEVLTQGSGAMPKLTDTVKTHYEGKLISGEVFDSSIARGEPAEFPLNRVIRGWTEALQLMPTGSTYRLFIPSELAYGNRGTPGIPPQSTLIFDVELIEILAPQAQ